jgi:hypothetical protein
MKKVTLITMVGALFVYLGFRGIQQVVIEPNDRSTTVATEYTDKYHSGAAPAKLDGVLTSNDFVVPPHGNAISNIGANRGELSAIQSNVEKHYGKAIKSLGLAATREGRLIYLLADRIQSAVDAQNISTAQGAGTSGDLLKAVEVAREVVDQQLMLEFGDVIDKIEVIIEHQRSLRTIAQTIDPAMEAMGYPLSPSQTLNLAVLFSDVYGNPRPPESFPGWAHIEHGDRISAYDKRLLDAIGNILSDAQTDALNAILIRQHITTPTPKR